MIRIAPRNVALPLSVALHVAVLLAVSRASWVASEARASLSPPAPLVWLEMRPREPAIEPIEPAPMPDEAPSTVAPPEPEPADPVREHEAGAAAAERVLEPSTQPVEPAPATTESSPSSPPAPRIDWEKARRAAAAAVIEGHGPAGEGPKFSLDDSKKPQPLPVEPAPPPMVADDCVIATNRLTRFAAQMMGRCVRDARGDLFAAIMPGYLTARPVCVETRPESPGAVTSQGELISTVKCELVADEED